MLSNFSLLEYFDGGIQLLCSHLKGDEGPSKYERMRARGEGDCVNANVNT